MAGGWKFEKPRARTTAGEEVELERYHLFSSRDLPTEAALVRMLAGLSTRRYRAGLEPIGKLEAKAIARSAISRRFVAGTSRKLAELMGRDLRGSDLLALFIDGIETAEHTIVAALGVDAEARVTSRVAQAGCSCDQQADRVGRRGCRLGTNAYTRMRTRDRIKPLLEGCISVPLPGG